MTAVVRGRRRGAPKKKPEEHQTVAISFRLTTHEHAVLQEVAAAAQRPRAFGRFLFERGLAREPKIVPSVNRELWSHLGKWAGAFTTIANAAAGERLGDLMPHLEPSLTIALEQVRAELRATRLALLGLDEETLSRERAPRVKRASDENAEDPEDEWNDDWDADTIDPDAPMEPLGE